MSVEIQAPAGLRGIGLAEPCLKACLEGAERAVSVSGEAPQIKIQLKKWEGAVWVYLTVDDICWLSVMVPPQRGALMRVYAGAAVDGEVGTLSKIWSGDTKGAKETAALSKLSNFAFGCVTASSLRSKLLSKGVSPNLRVVAGYMRGVCEVGVGVFPEADLLGGRVVTRQGGLVLCFLPTKWRLSYVGPTGMGGRRFAILTEGDYSDADALKQAADLLLTLSPHFSRGVVSTLNKLLVKMEVDERFRDPEMKHSKMKALINSLPEVKEAGLEALVRALLLCEQVRRRQ